MIPDISRWVFEGAVSLVGHPLYFLNDWISGIIGEMHASPSSRPLPIVT